MIDHVSDGSFIPAGHWIADDATPLIKLLMRNLAAAPVGPPGGERKTMSHWIMQKHCDGSDHGDLYTLARYVIESLPAEVTLLSGGCGGEAIVACYTHEGYDEALKRFNAFWSQGGDHDNDPLFPIVERIPLVKR